MDAANAGKGEREARLLERELVRGLALVRRAAQALDRLRGHGDAGHLAAHVLQAAGAAGEQDRGQHATRAVSPSRSSAETNASSRSGW